MKDMNAHKNDKNVSLENEKFNYLPCNDRQPMSPWLHMDRNKV